MRDGPSRWASISTGRRQFVVGLGATGVTVGLLPLLRLLPSQAATSILRGTGAPRFFDEHQWSVVEEATARLIPGPNEDPAETMPGAREAGVVTYVDRLLSAFDDSPPLIYAGGPWSNRADADDNPMASFVSLRPWEEAQWRRRIVSLQDTYRVGIAELDTAAGGDFAAVGPGRRDDILTADTPSRFRRVLFVHAVEGMYAVPEYGGNSDLSGWGGIGFGGDVAPSAWPNEKVRRSDGSDAVPAGFEMPFPAQLIDGTLPGPARALMRGGATGR